MKDTRQLKVFSLAVNEVELKQCSWQYSVEPYSNIIIPTPLSCGGCVIVGLETITYYNKDYHKSIPLAKVCTLNCNIPYSILHAVYSIPLAKVCTLYCNIPYSIPVVTVNVLLEYINNYTMLDLIINKGKPWPLHNLHINVHDDYRIW